METLVLFLTVHNLKYINGTEKTVLYVFQQVVSKVMRLDVSISDGNRFFLEIIHLQLS
jgi:hypothetical protein